MGVTVTIQQLVNRVSCGSVEISSDNLWKICFCRFRFEHRTKLPTSQASVLRVSVPGCGIPKICATKRRCQPKACDEDLTFLRQDDNRSRRMGCRTFVDCRQRVARNDRAVESCYE